MLPLFHLGEIFIFIIIIKHIKTETDLPSTGLLPKCLQQPGLESGQSQEPGTQSRISRCISGTKLLEILRAVF